MDYPHLQRTILLNKHHILEDNMDLIQHNYLDILHQKLGNITDISGVSELIDGSYRIDYIVEPTSSQLEQINNIIQSWPLEKAKLEKLEDIDKEWEVTLENGWATPHGWKMGITTQDVALLNGNFTLAKEASNLGITDPIFVIDTDGESHEFNLQDLTMLMLQYGQARAMLSSQDAAKRKAIKNATTIEELNNLNV
jgi:hypothetical protein